jgi:hypothetical protein
MATSAQTGAFFTPTHLTNFLVNLLAHGYGNLILIGSHTSTPLLNSAYITPRPILQGFVWVSWGHTRLANARYSTIPSLASSLSCDSLFASVSKYSIGVFQISVTAPIPSPPPFNKANLQKLNLEEIILTRWLLWIDGQLIAWLSKIKVNSSQMAS